MKLALFDDHPLGVVTGDRIVGVTAALPRPHDPDPLTAGWWRRLYRDFAEIRDALAAAAAGTDRAVDDVRLRAPVLNPSKIVACAGIFTGAPPGVGPIRPGDVLDTRISGIGEMLVRVT